MGLSSVLDHADAVTPANLKNRVHLGALTEEVHRNDGFGFRRDRSLELRRIHGVSLLIDVDENWSSTGVADGLRGSHECAGHCDDFVPRTNPSGQQSEPESVGAVAQPDGVAAFAIGGEIFLKGGDERAPSEGGGVDDLADSLIDFGAERCVMGAEIEERNSS